LEKLAARHQERGNIITMMTVVVPSFAEWHQVFEHWGRILRGTDGHIAGIREFKDASDEEKAITEVNPSLFCFAAKWLWENIEKLRNSNVAKEYYLTDLVGLAVTQGQKISSLTIAPEEAVGINTPAEREIAEKILAERK
jgi:bifunctional UDP-N-acetylglucosamine pyrophosphorylase/glucosamine-1-phosphate N-acetyltransferase